MLLKKAVYIVGECQRMVLRSMEIPATAPNVEMLKGLTLSELLEAHHLVTEENKRKMSLAGPVQMNIVCDDRLVAAIYVALHYEPETSGADVEGILATEAGRLCYISAKSWAG